MKTFDRVDVKAGPEGRFVALIATFNKADKSGDVIRPGAFAASITRWQASGARVPVIYSHRHGDPQAVVGEVEPTDLRETALGLEASGLFYLDEANGAKVFKQMQRRTLKEWSFGYLVQKAKTLAAGTRELLQIDLLELGPTLVGMGDTSTIGLKDAVTPVRVDALTPHRIRLDLVRRRLALERALDR
jgi:uncharacterized protein